MNGREHSLLRGISSSAIYGVSSIVAGLALLPLVFSTVGAPSYGAWLLLTSLATYLFQADLGMGSAIVHFLSRSRGDGNDLLARQRIVTNGATWMALSGFVALPVYAAIAFVFVAPVAKEAGVAGTSFSAMAALGGVLTALIGLRAFSSALQGSGFWVYERTTMLVGVGVRIVGTSIACLWLDSIVAVAVAEAVALLTPPLLSTAKAVSAGLVSFRRELFSRSQLKQMFHYGIRSFAVGSIAAILLQADTLIVGIVATAAAVSYYAAAFRIYMAVRQILGWISEPLLPAMSRLFVNDRPSAVGAFIGMQFSVLWIAVGACSTLVLAAPTLLPIWLGSAVPASEIGLSLSILLAGLMVNATHIAAIPVCDATGRPGAFLRLHLIWCGLNIVLSLVLGLQWGIVGVAAGTALPLLVLEPFYLRRIAAVLGVPVRTWAWQCLRPVASFFAVGAVAAGLIFATIETSSLSRHAQIFSAVAFAAAYLVATRVAKSIVPTASMRAAAATRV